MKRVVVPGLGKKIPNVGNGSTQLNFSNGFWQIDKSGGGWVSTAFEPVLPPCWTRLSFRHFMDSKKYSVLSTNWGGMQYVVPGDMQNLPLGESDWAAVVAVQLQTEVLQPGEVSVYFRNISLTVSAQPF